MVPAWPAPGVNVQYDSMPTSVLFALMSGRSAWPVKSKFNGVAYPIQKAAAAIYTDAGKQQTAELINHYLANAKLIRDAITKLGFTCIGGDNAPYIWVNTGRDSWEFFDLLLNEAQVVCTPGAGFGKCGEGHVRISAFNSRANVETALARIAAALK